MTLAVAVGARLRKARGDRPVADVARAIGITTATLYRWEAGSISVPHERWLAVSDVLGAPWHELFDPNPDVGA